MTIPLLAGRAGAFAVIALLGCASPKRPSSAAEPFVVVNLSEQDWLELVPGLRVKAVLGSNSTFALAEVAHGFATAPHHHHHEQFNLGVRGRLGITIGGTTYELDNGLVTWAPSNVQHSVANQSGDLVEMIEFQPVRRLDLVAPRQQVTFPSSPTPAALVSEQQLILGFRQPSPDSSDAGVSSLLGEATRLEVRRLIRADQASSWSASRQERMIYVLEGFAEAISGEMRAPITTGSLILLPAGEDLSIRRTSGASPLTVVVYDPDM